MASIPALEIPPLSNGDRLTRAEFERIWALHPEIKRAELINGMVFVDVTVSRQHGKPHHLLSVWTGPYLARHPGVEALDNVTVRLGDGTDVQPDLALRVVDGGTSTVSVDDCVEGPPEFIAEIAASSASYDLHIKKPLYERSGVSEYLVWTQYERRLEWWTLVNGRYAPLQPDATGAIESIVFPGLRLPVDALMEGDISALLVANAD